ncbi:hypothetical protein BDF19DRAFT_107286 [Syncephalis fuscata]|nr:hypothetical protein BDF19DRAFT_107286 [Syncephalis fuscata]
MVISFKRIYSRYFIIITKYQPDTAVNNINIIISEDEENESESEEDEDEEISNDTHGHLANLKARKRELEDLLTADRRDRRLYERTTTSTISKTNSATQSSTLNKPHKLSPDKITTLLIDTNMFIRDLSTIKCIIQSGHWSIILPLAVVIELDGLQKNDSALGVAAREAITYLEIILP